MRLVPTCDETWMWMWAMLGGKNFRQSSWVFDESEYTLDGTQKMPTTLWRQNRNIYDQMYETLFREHPEFREELLRRRRICVSATPETLESTMRENPYVPVVVGEGEEELMKEYQDCPNKIIQGNKGTLYPPGHLLS